MWLHPYVLCILIGCWILSIAILVAFAHGSTIGKRQPPREDIAAQLPSLSEYLRRL